MSTTHPPPGPERRAQPRGAVRGRGGNALYGVFRWIGRHVRGFHAAVGAFLAGAALVVLAASVAFLLLAEQVQEGRTQTIDERILLWIDARSTPFLDVAALEVTALGGVVVVWTLIAVLSAFFWVTHHRYSAVLLWVAMIGAGVISSALKAAFGRPRPQVVEWGTTHVDAGSFPSGHSMTAVVAYATVAYLIARLEPTPVLRRLTIGGALFIIALIGLTRLYLGVHYPSDVLAGFAIGAAWAGFAALGMEAVRYFRTRKPDIEQVERDLDARVGGPTPEES